MAVTSMRSSSIRDYNRRNGMRVPSISVSGGTETDITVGADTYRVHTFTSSDTMSIVTGGVIEYLVVAGGGGGGCQTSSNNRGGGGGGAGGLLTGALQVESGNYTITVGAGGQGFGTYNTVGTQGGNSSIGTEVVATGGGFGGSSDNSPASGGSGGGGGHTGGASGISGQGFAGGNGGSGGSTTGGSGGGSGGAGNGQVSSSSVAIGGLGTTTAFNGTSYLYASGGDSWLGNSTPTVRNKYGDGGNSTVGGTGGTAQDGIVIVRYKV